MDSDANFPTSSNPESARKKPRRCRCCSLEGHDIRNCPVRALASPSISSRLPAVFHSGGRIVPAPAGAVVDPNIYDNAGNPVDEDGNLYQDVNEVVENDPEEQERYLDPVLEQDNDVENGPEPVFVAEDNPFSEEKWTEFQVHPLPLTQNRSGSFPASIFPEISTRGYSEKGSVQNMPNEALSASQLLELYFDDTIIETFVRETNSYAENSTANMFQFWTAIDAPELKNYFSIVLFMGINILPDRSMYWGNDPLYRSEFVLQLMKRDRFMAINSALHWFDASHIPAADRAARNRVDGFWTIASFFDQLSNNFGLYYKCGRFLSVDEMTIFFKGIHRCKCYNPSKPNKWHFKAFCLNDAANGYLSNFCMYRGKDETRPPGMSATMFPVIKLTESLIYHNNNHVLGIDNWYTSVELVLALLDRGIHVCGTIRRNKTKIPKNGLFPDKGPRKRNRGDILCRTLSINGKQLFLTAWQDNKPVHCLSTWGPFHDPVDRNSIVNGHYQLIQIPRPTVIKAYNATMGGTDKFDQYGSYYDDRVRSITWQMRIFKHFLRAAVINAHCIYRMTTKEITLLDFTKLVILEWAYGRREDYNEVTDDVFFGRLDGERSSAWWKHEIRRRTQGRHTPIISDTNARRRCKVCKVQSGYFCKECGVALHLEKSGATQCWQIFHSTEW